MRGGTHRGKRYFSQRATRGWRDRPCFGCQFEKLAVPRSDLPRQTRGRCTTVRKQKQEKFRTVSAKYSFVHSENPRRLLSDFSMRRPADIESGDGAGLRSSRKGCSPARSARTDGESFHAVIPSSIATAASVRTLAAVGMNGGKSVILGTVIAEYSPASYAFGSGR